MKYQDFSCLKSDIFITHSEDIDVAMATVISTNNKRAFRLCTWPLLLLVLSKWFQVIKTVSVTLWTNCQLFTLDREEEEHRKIYFGY